MSTGRYTPFGPVFNVHRITQGVAEMCEDCGAVVLDKKVHDRFHAILNHHGKALAILKVAHIAAHVHDKYEAYDKIGNPTDSWSAEAFEDVTGRRSRECPDDSPVYAIRDKETP